MSDIRQKYATDLTDRQWAIVEPLLTGLKPGSWSKRELINAVLYVTENGIKWRNLPHDFPPWQTVYSFFRRAKIKGIWEDIMVHLVEMTRKKIWQR